MGVLRWFYYIYQNFSECLIQLKEGETLLDKNIKIDTVSLDGNIHIHAVCQVVYKYGSGAVKDEEKKGVIATAPPDDDTVFNKICQTIEEFRHITQPQKCIVIVFDSVAPLAKCQQQKERRYRSALERKTNLNEHNKSNYSKNGNNQNFKNSKTEEAHSDSTEFMFDSCNITAGTEFMSKLSSYVNRYIQTQVTRNKDWQALDVIFSDDKDIGEGESKCVRLMRLKQNTFTHVIHSADADVIFLMLGLNLTQKSYIIRSNLFVDKHPDCKYFVIDVLKLRELLLQNLKVQKSMVPLNDNLIINDFILMCFFFGQYFKHIFRKFYFLGQILLFQLQLKQIQKNQ